MTDLEYEELDLAVAHAEIAAGQLDVRIADSGIPTIQDVEGRWERFRPSVSWAHAGPIIERERISIASTSAVEWIASRPRSDHPYDMQQVSCPSPLIAAMRAYVDE